MKATLFLLALAAALPAHAAPWQGIDTPVRSGSRAPADAAVVIGVEDYPFLTDVPYARRDAESFYDFLIYTRGVSPERARILSAGASREQIEQAVAQAGRSTGPSGTVWVYFAGHGVADPESGARLLLGDDARPDVDTLRRRAVAVDDVQRAAASGGGDVVLVVDACYNGTSRGGEALIPGRRFAVPVSAHRAATEGVLAWHAAGPDQTSGPLAAAEHGAFTYFVLGALRGWADGHLDGYADGQVTIAEADAYVRRSLSMARVYDQTPVVRYGQRADYVLSSGRLEAGVDPLAPPADAPRAEVAVYEVPPPHPAPSAADTAPDARPDEDDLRAELEALASLQGRDPAVSAAAAALRLEASEVWALARRVGRGGGEEAEQALQRFIAAYEDAAVEVAGQRVEVEVAEVELARDALAKLRQGESAPRELRASRLGVYLGTTSGVRFGWAPATPAVAFVGARLETGVGGWGGAGVVWGGVVEGVGGEATCGGAAAMAALGLPLASERAHLELGVGAQHIFDYWQHSFAAAAVLPAADASLQLYFSRSGYIELGAGWRVPVNVHGFNGEEDWQDHEEYWNEFGYLTPRFAFGFAR